MRVRKHLLYALEDLRVYDYKKFKEFLSLKVLDDCTPIPRGLLQDVPPNDTVSMMIERYGEESAVSLTLKILKEMNFNGIAEDLQHALAAEQTASPSASSPAVAPSAAAPGAPGPPSTILAQQGAEQTASPSASSPAVAPSAAAPAAPATMMADQGGVILAPDIKDSSINTMNIVITRDSTQPGWRNMCNLY